MNDAQKAFALDLIMGRIHEHLEQVQWKLKDKQTPFLLGQKSVLTAYEVLWNQIQAAIQDPMTSPDVRPGMQSEQVLSPFPPGYPMSPMRKGR